MNHPTEAVNALQASTADNFSNAAGLLDDKFMDQFAPLPAEELYYQTEFDDWLTGCHAHEGKSLEDAAIPKAFSPILGCAVSYPSASVTSSLKQDADTLRQQQSTNISPGYHSIGPSVPHLPSLKQLPNNSYQPKHQPLPSFDQLQYDMGQPKNQHLPNFDQVRNDTYQPIYHHLDGIKQVLNDIGRPEHQNLLSIEHVLHEISHSEHERIPSMKQVPYYIGQPRNQHLSTIEQSLHDIFQSHGQYSPNSVQDVNDIAQAEDLQDRQTGAGLNELLHPDSSDKKWKTFIESAKYIEDFEDLFGFTPELGSSDLINSLTATASIGNHSLSRCQKHLNGVITPELTWGSPAQHDDKLIVPAPISNSTVPLTDWSAVVQEGSHPTQVPRVEYRPAKVAPVKKTLSTTKRGKVERKEPLNSRRANIERTDPTKYYEEVPETPYSWSPPGTDNTFTFQYNQYGELVPSDRFSPEQIYQYLFYHPLNYDLNGNYNYQNGRLILWIQVTPADAGRRYPHVNSSKCRFQDCPVPNNTIRKGFFRIALDETTATGRQVDPYHCAGFVHLFCLEKFCDFPTICRTFTVLPDQRSLPEGRNRMAVTRDHPEMIHVVSSFMKSSNAPNPWDYEKTLCFQLTSKHLELEASVRRNLRAARGGNHIAIHKGDIDKYVEGEMQKVIQRRTGPGAPKPPKRKREIECKEEEDVKVEEIADVPPTKRKYKFRLGTQKLSVPPSDGGIQGVRPLQPLCSLDSYDGRHKGEEQLKTTANAYACRVSLRPATSASVPRKLAVPSQRWTGHSNGLVSHYKGRSICRNHRMSSMPEKPALQVIVLGSGGGPIEDNTTAFLVRSVASEWKRGSLLAVDAGTHIAGVARILERHAADNRLGSLQAPATMTSGPFNGLHLPCVSVNANAAHITQFLIDAYLISHPHLDHIAGFVINTAGLPNIRPKRLAALPSTIEAFKKHIFNDIIWPNLTDENNGVGMITYMRLVDGGSPALGDGDGKGYVEICEGLSVKALSVSHGHCLENSGRSGSGTEMFPYRYQPGYEMPPQLANSNLVNNGQVQMPSKHFFVKPTKRLCVYDSAAYFIRDIATGREVLIFGDVEPDSISVSPRNLQVWIDAAPKIVSGILNSIFIECSYTDAQRTSQMYGHLAPRFLIEELKGLAVCVQSLRQDDTSKHHQRKRKRPGSAHSADHSPRRSPRITGASYPYPKSENRRTRQDTGSIPSVQSLALGSDGSLSAPVPSPTSHPMNNVDPSGNSSYHSEETLTSDSSHGLFTGAAASPLRGLKVYVIHVKDTLTDDEPAGEVILRQLRVLEQEHKLGCEFVLTRPGLSIYA